MAVVALPPAKRPIVDDPLPGMGPLTVGIIGGGVSGVSACKEALEQGLLPTLFEKAEDLGGVWKYDGTGCVYAGLQTNISKYSCCFSDFPWNPETPLFPTAKDVHTYISQFAEKNKIHEHVRLGTTVMNLEQLENRTWQITWLQQGCGSPQRGTEVFDRIIVATGVQSTPIRPNIEGLESFPGLVVHSAAYPGPELFKDQKVLCVGASFSGADIAREVTTVASSCTTVARHGTWYVSRMVHRLPLDIVFYQRKKNPAEAEKRWAQCAIEQGDELKKFKSKAMHDFFLGLCEERPEPLLVPDFDKDETFIAITDGFMESVKDGRMKIKTVGIKNVSGQEVTFADDDTESFDAIILATGYNTELPFLSPEQLRKIEFSKDDCLQPMILHKSVWRPELPNLAFVGIYKGNYLGMCELQARWACGVFSGEIPCPTRQRLLAGLDEERATRRQMPRPQFPHGDYVKYADGMAEEMGVSPEEILTDRSHPLHRDLVRCPVLPCHYRLVGSGAKPQVAMATILECLNHRDGIYEKNDSDQKSGVDIKNHKIDDLEIERRNNNLRKIDDAFIAVRAFLHRSAYSPYIVTNFQEKTIWAPDGSENWVKLFSIEYDGGDEMELLFDSCLKKRCGRTLRKLVNQESAAHRLAPEAGKDIERRITWVCNK